ncbi:MAG: DUF6702 family protein [Bacteroidota bacterium]
MKKVLILVTIFFLVAFKHPFYLSVTDLKYNTREKALQGSVKIFINDLESALKNINKKNTDLVNVKDTAEVTKQLTAYLKSHLYLKLNGKEKTFRLIGFEKEEEAIWIYLEFKNCELPKKLEINNTILFEYIKQQTNIVHLEVGSDKKSAKVSNPDKNLIFDF